MFEPSVNSPFADTRTLRKRRIVRLLARLASLCLVWGITATASAQGPSVRGTLPAQDGQLMGNTVMFVGYDLVEGGTTPKVQVADDTDKSIVPVKVTARCQAAARTPSGAKGPRRCNVLVRLMRWTVGHQYRAVLHGYTLKFTIIPGDPGVGRRPDPKKKKQPTPRRAK